MRKIGKIRTYSSSEIEDSYVSIGFECLDRELFKPERCYDPLALTGVKYARCQTGWARCEKEKGVYDFAWLDSVVDNLLSRGVKPWFNVGYGNSIYMPDVPNPTAVGCVPLYYGEECLEAWKGYVKALAEHFGTRITHYEIWNEPDSPSFWYPMKPSGAEYAKFVDMTAEIIRSVQPEAKIGICVSAIYWFKFVKETIESIGHNTIDFFAFHVYSRVPEYRYAGLVSSLRGILDKNGFPNVELWQGEGGYPSWAYEGHWLIKEGCDDERAQAVWQLRRYFLDVYNGVKLSSFFQMADMWEKPYAKAVQVLKKPAAQGILNGLTYTPKESYKTIRNLSAIFSGDIAPTKNYMHVDLNYDSVMELISCQTMTFKRNECSIYAYYLPLEIGKKHEMEYTASVFTNELLESPVLIDTYTGEVFEVEKISQNCGLITYEDLPIKDYPLMLTEKGVFELDE